MPKLTKKQLEEKITELEEQITELINENTDLKYSNAYNRIFIITLSKFLDTLGLRTITSKYIFNELNYKRDTSEIIVKIPSQEIEEGLNNKMVGDFEIQFQINFTVKK